MRIALLTLAALVCFPLVALASGGHDSLDCVGCHGIHTAKGEIIFAVDPNTLAVNPRTNAPYTGITALCLGCHEENGGMGILPVHAKSSHPYGVTPNPKRANVPADLLRSGKLECVGCHDPHPSNPNHRYLRVDTKGGQELATFCSLCHSSKSGKRPAAVFSSMDERQSPAQ